MRVRVPARPRGTAVLAVAVSSLALSCATASAMPSGAARTTDVSVASSGFSPTKVTVLTGDTIAWTDLGGNHTVTSVDNVWASATLFLGDTFRRRFDTSGTFAYFCTIHRYMTGEVDVVDLLLDSVPQPAAPGRALPLRGRAALPAGTELTVEADTGGGFVPVGTTDVADDGTFATTVTPRTTTTYRVASGQMTSPGVLVRVLDRRVTVSAARRGSRETLTARVSPASPGATVVLQFYLRERFGWWPVGQVKLDRSSRARFTVRPPHRVSARVVLTLPDGATPLAVSPTLRIAP